MRHLLSLLFLTATAATQAPQTFVVDIANGPGTQFTDLDTAVDTVPDGSILLVRAGSYPNVSVLGKGITLLCNPGVTTNGFFVDNTAPNQPVVTYGLDTPLAFVAQAAGLVLLVGNGLTMTFWISPMRIVGSAQVCVRNYSINGVGLLAPAAGCFLDSSTVVFENCRIQGSHGSVNIQIGAIAPGPGIIATNSDVQLTHCSVSGGNGLTNAGVIPGAPAIELTGGSVRALGDLNDFLASGSTPGAPARSAILGSGNARVAPAVVMSGNPVVAPTVSLTRPLMPALTATDAPVGGILSATWSGAPGSQFFLAIGLPGPTIRLAGVLDPLWLGLSNIDVVAFGLGPGTGTFTSQIAVPNQGNLLATRLVWQAAEFSANAVQLSNPAPTLVR